MKAGQSLVYHDIQNLGDEQLAMVKLDCIGVLKGKPAHVAGKTLELVTPKELHRMVNHEIAARWMEARRTTKRTDAQNAYWWGVVIYTIADFMGEEDHDKVHYDVLAKFLPERLNAQGKPMKRSSSRLTIKEFGELIEKVIKYFQETWNVIIPPPIEQIS